MGVKYSPDGEASLFADKKTPSRTDRKGISVGTDTQQKVGKVKRTGAILCPTPVVTGNCPLVSQSEQLKQSSFVITLVSFSAS